MDFQARLQKELQQTKVGGTNEDVDYPNSHLKHKELYFPENQNALTFRILPPANDEDFFSVTAQEIFLSARNNNGKTISARPVFPEVIDPENSALEAALIEWQAQERVPNRFNQKARPSKVFYMNVIQILVDNAGNFVHETDQQGQPVVRLLKMKTSAYNQVLEKLSDPYMKPENSDNYSFISAQNAFPIKMTKPVKGATNMSYGIDIYQRSLGALPPNWKDMLEDLNYQATPSSEYNSEWEEYFISVVNGTEETSNSGGQQQNQQQQNFNQGYQQQQQNQQPQQPQQNWGNQQQQTQQNWGNQQQPYQAPQQQQQQQPYQAPPQQQNTQPPAQQQNWAPQQNVDTQFAPQQAPQNVVKQGGGQEWGQPNPNGAVSQQFDASAVDAGMDNLLSTSPPPAKTDSAAVSQETTELPSVDELMGRMKNNLG